jgi:hypothetical protein
VDNEKVMDKILMPALVYISDSIEINEREIIAGSTSRSLLARDANKPSHTNLQGNSSGCENPDFAAR